MFIAAVIIFATTIVFVKHLPYFYLQSILLTVKSGQKLSYIDTITRCLSTSCLILHLMWLTAIAITVNGILVVDVNFMQVIII